MGLFNRDMGAAYMPIQLAGDLAKIANLSAQAKGKSSSRPFEDAQTKAWYENALKVCGMVFHNTMRKHGPIDNHQAFQLLFECICIIDQFEVPLDHDNSKTTKIMNELYQKYKEFSKPSLKNLSEETVHFLSRLTT